MYGVQYADLRWVESQLLRTDDNETVGDSIKWPLWDRPMSRPMTERSAKILLFSAGGVVASAYSTEGWAADKGVEGILRL